MPKLKIDFGWKTESTREAGNKHPAGSNLNYTKSQLDTSVSDDIQNVIDNPRTADELASTLKANPADYFRTLKNEFKVCDVGNYHFHERCIKCSGNGRHDCDAYGCSYGMVACTQCHDGRRRCYSCGGSGSISVQTRDYQGNYHNQNATCRECGGNGRTGSCPSCFGKRKVNCLTCNGTNKVNCSPCKATGSFLNRTKSWITGLTRRTVSLEDDVPDGFKRSVSSISLVAIPGLMADTTATHVSSEPSCCRIALTCSMPHVHVDARCKEVPISLDAVGRDGFVPLMPTFLDKLLAKPFGDMLQLSASPDTVIRAAESSRLTRELLAKTYTGKKFDADAMAISYDRAISSSMLTSGHTAIVRAFNALGASATKAAWLIGGPVLILYAAITAFYDVGFWLPGSFQPPSGFSVPTVYAWDAGLLALPILIFWFIAGLLSRRAVQKATRSSATRRPSQGLWPVGFAIAMIAAHGLPILQGVDASSLGLPRGAAWRRSTMFWHNPPSMLQPYNHSTSTPYVPSRHPVYR